MDFFKAQFDRIQQQLAGLNASQKMLTAALVAIMVMTWCGGADTPAKPKWSRCSISRSRPRAIGRMRSRARRARASITPMSGDSILVPADRKLEALALSAIARACRADTKAASTRSSSRCTPFDSQQTGRQDVEPRQGDHLVADHQQLPAWLTPT